MPRELRLYLTLENSEAAKRGLAEVEQKFTGVGQAFDGVTQQEREFAAQMRESTRAIANEGQAAADAIENIGGASKKAQEAVTAIATTADTAQDRLSKIGGALQAAFSSREVLQALGAIGESSTRVVALAGHIDDLAQKTGLSAEAVQELDYVAKLSGSSFDQVSSAIGLMSARLVGGDASAVGALQRMGLSLETLRGSAPDQAFTAIATAIAAIPDPMQRSKAAMDVFGRSGAELLPVLTSHIGELREQARSTGAVLSDDLIEKGDQLGDAWDRVNTRMQALQAEALLPVLGLFTQLPAPLQTVAALGGSLAPVFGHLGVAILAAGGPTAAITALTGVVGTAGTALVTFATGPVGLTIAALAGLGLAIYGVAKYFEVDMTGAIDKASQALAEKHQRIKDMDFGALRPLTMTLDEQRAAEEALTKSVEGHIAATKKADEEAKAFAKAMGELDLVGIDVQRTIAGLNGDVVEAVKYYLQAGVSQSTLATAYGLTTKQVKAVSLALQEQITLEKQLADIHAKEIAGRGAPVPALMGKETGPGQRQTYAEQLPTIGDLLKQGFDASTLQTFVTNTTQQLRTAALQIAPPFVKAFEPEVVTLGHSVTTNLRSGISEGLASLGPSLVSALQGGGNIPESLGATFGLSLTKKVFGGEMLQKSITSVFGQTLGGAFNAILPGIGALAGPLISGLGKLFGKLFGGPSETELAGRSAAGQFRDELYESLTAAQQLEASGNRQNALHIAIRDAIHDEAKATELVDKLWRAEKEGPEAVKAVWEEITAVLKSALPAAIDQTGQAAEAVIDAAGTRAEQTIKRIAMTALDAVKMLGGVTGAIGHGGGGDAETEWSPSDFLSFVKNNGLNDASRFAENYLAGSDARNQAGNQYANWLNDTHYIAGNDQMEGGYYTGAELLAAAQQDQRDSQNNQDAALRSALGLRAGGLVPQYFATGNMVRALFRPQGTDIVPAMLTPGEGIVNTRGMQRLGASGLDALNRGEGFDAIAGEIRALREEVGRAFQEMAHLQARMPQLWQSAALTTTGGRL